MSKVLIPFSGGINSTYALYKFLAETSHDITAVYAKESWVNVSHDPQRQSREKQTAETIVSWLKSNVRDFTFEIKSDWPTAFNDVRPIRAGFTKTYNYGICVARYKGYAELIETHNPDMFVIGNSVENTATDAQPECHHLYWKDGLTVVYAGTPDLTPTLKEPYDYDTVAASLIGRFEQFEALPTALSELIETHCPTIHDPRVNDVEFHCLRCLYHLAHTELDYTGKELDDMFAKHGSYGAWRNEADPETYVYRGAPQYKVIELLGLEEAFHMVPPPIPE